MRTIYKYRFQILITIFVMNVAFVWPGELLQDSLAQYKQAISGQYSDHHPPMMSFIWHYLNKIVEGGGLLFLLQLTLLYASVGILLKTLDNMIADKSKHVLCAPLLILPIYPQVLIYSGLVIKDVQYAFSFLFAASILAYYTMLQRRPPIAILALILPVMVYGAAVKYQGQFCVIVLSLWLGGLLVLRKPIIIKVIVGLLTYTAIFFTIAGINNILVPEKSKNYAWQFVKLYDLAAISIGTQTDLIPSFNKTDSYTFYKIQQRFQYPGVDPYIYSNDNILQVTKDSADMNMLYRIWLANVLKHPYLYLKHRAMNAGYMVLSRPGYDYVQKILAKTPKEIYGLTSILFSTFFYIFMSHLPIILLGCAYFILGMYSWSFSVAAPILVGFSSVALLMCAILFFMSMAGVTRYTYISIVMINAIHIFAYKCYLDCKRRR